MYGLPTSTERKQQLPKKAIYAKFDLKPAQRESFDADISRIDIVAVVSQETIPALGAGTSVTRFYVLEIQMKRRGYDVKNILLLDRLIGQKMVFALKYENQVRFAVFHTKLFESDWKAAEEATLLLSGLNLDSVWENIIKQVGQIDVEEGRLLNEQIRFDEQQAKIGVQIKMLERKLAIEKQPRKKREYFELIRRLKETIS